LEKKKIEEFLKRKFKIGDFNIAKLAGDASDRAFFRVETGEGVFDGRCTAVLMVTGESWTEELPFLNVRRYMHGAGLPVPGLYLEDAESGMILLEDFGDITLEQAVEGLRDEEMIPMYRHAIDLLLRVQIEGTKQRDDECIAFGLAFDVKKLMYEFNFFYIHALTGYKRARVIPADELIIRDGFQDISRVLAAESKYFTHRDYHSRNIMVQKGVLKLVDFQDARLGPLQYDLASLLMDSYVDLPDSVIRSSYEHYLKRLEFDYMMKIDHAKFDRLFDYMVFQRNIKAAGSFAYLDCVKCKNRYLQYFKPCLARVRSAAMRQKELHPVYEALARYIEELR